MVRFILGVVAGGLAVWFWGDQIREFAESQTKGVRVGAEDVLDRAKEQVSSALQAGQDVIRPRTLSSTPGRSTP